MRVLIFFAGLGGILSQSNVSAQEIGAVNSEVDFSGIYAVGVYTGVPTRVEEPDVYPFTEEGERTHNAYDRFTLDPRQLDDCVGDPVPELLWSANPMEIVQEEGRILMRFEENDTTRSIIMNGTPLSEEQSLTRLGYSIGHWEGSVLVIETTHMVSGVIFGSDGYPISQGTRITERYWRESGENDLQVEILIDDSINYTETVRLGRQWVWSPDEQVRPWGCFSLGPRDSEPDIDGLARMLEEL